MDSHDPHDTERPFPDDWKLCIQLLGDFSVSRHGQHVDASSWRFHNAKRLVQILALMPGRRIHREQIVEWFWPDTATKQANNSLHQILHHARRALTSIGVDGRTLRLERGLLTLSAPEDMLWVDVEVFEASAREAMTQSDPETCRAALGLYSGELLPEERYADWAASRRDALHNVYLSLLLHLGEIHEARGNLAGAEEVYGNLIAEDEANESGHAGLMRVFARSGRRHQGVVQYQRLEAALERELDIEPSAEILELRGRIEQGAYSNRVTASHPRMQPATGEPAFVGREPELYILQSAIERSFSGDGCVLMLSGEPGVGKTRVAREAAAYANRSGSTVLWGSCYQDEGAPPYWPWVQIMRDAIRDMETATMLHLMGHGATDIGQIVPEVWEQLPDLTPPAGLGAEQARFQLFDSVTRFFKQLALRGPLLIVLDDLHWSDRSTLQLLSFLAHEIEHSRVVIVGAYRDTEPASKHPLVAALADLSRSRVLQRLSLTGLSEADVRQLVEGLARSMRWSPDPALVFQRTEGNPFFVGEILRMMRDDATLGTGSAQDWSSVVPPGVRDVISQRLSHLSPGCNAVLDVASVAGRDFTLNLLELAARLPRTGILDALDEALQSGLIEVLASGEGTYQFSHALVQETVYAGLASAHKASLHRRCGEALERLHYGEIDRYLNELAFHFTRAAVSGDVQSAVDYGLRAGDRALAQVAYSEAIDHFRRARDVITAHYPTAQTELLEVLLRLGDACNHTGDRAEACATFLRVMNLSRELMLPTEFARAALGFAGLGVFFGPADNIPLLEEAVAWLPVEDTVLRARILARLAFDLNDIASSERRALLLNEAEGIARRINDPSALIFVLMAKCLGFDTLDNLEARVATTAEVLALVHESGEVLLAPTAHAMGFYDGLDIGDMRFVDQQIASFVVLADRQRQPQRNWLALLFKAVREVVCGNYVEAEHVMSRAREIADAILTVEAHDYKVASMMIAIQSERGTLSSDFETMLEAAVQDDGENLYWRALLAWVRNKRLSSNGFERGIEELIHAIERVDRLDADSLAAAALLTQTDHVVECAPLARALYDVIEPYRKHNVVTRNNGRHWYGPASYFTGCLASVLGCLDTAEQHLQWAIERNERMQARPYLARSQYELAKVLRRRDEPGDSDLSGHLLNTACGLALEVGMPVLVNEIRAERMCSP